MLTRYQYKSELERHSKRSEQSDQEIIQMVSHADRYGYIDGSEEAQTSRSIMNDEREKAQIEKEKDRSQRWAKMIVRWDKWVIKNPKKVKKTRRKLESCVKMVPNHQLFLLRQRNALA